MTRFLRTVSLVLAVSVSAGCAPRDTASLPVSKNKLGSDAVAAAPTTVSTADNRGENMPSPKVPSVASLGFEPLPDNEAAVFFGSVEDAPPEVLNAQLESREGRHFLFSDEENPHKFYPKIKDLGGGFVGVGTDQCYLFAGWIRPHLAWIADYDPWVIALHRAYFAFFEAAENAETFISFWKPANLDASTALLERVYSSHEDKSNIVNVFQKAQERVYGRFMRLRKSLRKEGIPSFLSDADSYTFVRNLVLGKRVRALVGNLLDNRGLLGIAAVSGKLDVPIRALYLSNAESYWDYPPQFRENIRAMNFDERSLVMRTLASKPRNGDYCYATQSATDFARRLQNPGLVSIHQIWQDRLVRKKDQIRFVHIEAAGGEEL